MILTATILALPLLVLWLLNRGQRSEADKPFDPKWGGPYPSRASQQRAAMRKAYAETGLPPEPRHPYFEYLDRQAAEG